MRLIDADALKKAFCEECDKASPEEVIKCCGDRCSTLDMIDAQPTIEAEPVKWIPCSERMPEIGQDVLVVVEERDLNEETDEFTEIERYVTADTYKGNKFSWTYPEEVTHWMPLPEPPESEVQEND